MRGTRLKLLGAGALILAVLSMSASAQDIARWVDEQGVTHFGNPQFAPAGMQDVTLVEVQPANGMAVPVAPPVQKRGARYVVLKKKGKVNPNGWTGHQKQRRGAR